MKRLCPHCKDLACNWYWNSLCDRDIADIQAKAYERELEKQRKATEEKTRENAKSPNVAPSNPAAG